MTIYETLDALALCALMGATGQAARAIVGIKNLQGGQAGQQSVFDVSYFLLSLMIGAVAGIIAGMLMQLDTFLSINPKDLKPLLGIMAAGYAGADFIENSFSLLLPKPGTTNTTGNKGDGSGNGGATNNSPGSGGGAAAGSAAGNSATTIQAFSAAVPPSTDPALQAALQVVAPKIDTASWVPLLVKAFAKYDVNTDRRKAAAIGQFLVEAGPGFNSLTEHLNYTAAQLCQFFPHAFPDLATAEQYVGKPEDLANRAYANRNGNGDEASGDGYRFIGRGLIQLTGRTNYDEFGATLGKSAEDAAAYCATTEGAAMSGAWFLNANGCLPLADSWQIPRLSQKVNAGDEGLDQRLAYSNAMLKHLGGQ